jgi:branched-chain amino acid transport system permease protein
MSGLPQIFLFQGFDIVAFGLAFVNFYALYLAISLSLNLEFGYAGIPNFGKVLFIAAGASVAGSIAGRLAQYVLAVDPHRDFIVFSTTVVNDIDAVIATNPVFAVELFLISMVIGAAIGALFGYAASYPALRLREDYLGMLLLGVAQFWQVVMRTYVPLSGGAQNIAVPDPYFYWTTIGAGYRDLVAALIVSAFAVLVYLYAERVGRSPLARTLKAVREGEDAARSLGKNDAAIRRKILVVSSALAGMCGVLFTFYIASVEYDTWTRFAWTFWPFLIVIIGGAGNNFGVALGTFFFTLTLKGLEQAQPYLQPYIFFDANWLQDLLFAALLVTVLLLRPEGIIREKSAPTLPKRKLMTIVGESGGTAEEKGRTSRAVSRLRSALGRKEREAEPPPK